MLLKIKKRLFKGGGTMVVKKKAEKKVVKKAVKKVVKKATKKK